MRGHPKQGQITTQGATELGQYGKHFWSPEEEPITTQYASEWDATDFAMAQCVGCLFDMAARVGEGGVVVRRTVRGDVANVTKTYKNLNASCSQTENQNWYPK